MNGLLLVPAAILFVVGYALGAWNLVRTGHKCREDGCFARVGESHDKCPGHRSGIRVADTPDEDPRDAVPEGGYETPPTDNAPTRGQDGPPTREFDVGHVPSSVRKKGAEARQAEAEAERSELLLRQERGELVRGDDLRSYLDILDSRAEDEGDGFRAGIEYATEEIRTDFLPPLPLPEGAVEEVDE